MTSLNPARLDEITERLGYRFRNHALLTEALTHGSTQKHKGDYQRLEFLGDRVLGLLIAEHLFRAHPGDEEGQLTHVLSSLVRSEGCAEAGDTIGLSEEALVAAIYLDSGLEEARAFVLRCWDAQLKAPKLAAKDPKTFLQEWALARALPIPAYRIISREGPEHEPVFVVSVEVKDRPPAEGTAKAKRAAEMDAAEQFLKREGIRP